ncbi:MAG TPA: diguanylate cyclase [Vicinamibacterales bacterium]|nr:diguanylate cyclase [Vicinamibacterales bacterium]
MENPRKRRFSLTRHKHSLWALPAFGLLLVAGLWAATWVQLESTERALIGAATHTTETLAAEFEQYTRHAINDVDRMTLLVKHEFERHNSMDLAGLIREGLLVEGHDRVVLSIADTEGNVIARNQPFKPFNIADREYFRLHAERDTGSLDISKPVVGRTSRMPTVLLSRRLNRNGAFAGIVFVAVTPEYFTAYEDQELGKLGGLGLRGLDGTLRALRVGKSVTSTGDGSGPELVALAQTSPSGHYETESAVDHVTRIVAYRKLADYPFIVTAANAKDEVLADFYDRRRDTLIIRAAATVIIMLFFGVVTVLAVRLQRNRAELKDQRHFLETLVDNIPSGITVRSMRPENFGQYVLCSESNKLIFDTGKEVLGKTVLDIMPAKYAAQIMEFDRQLLASPMPQDIVQVRDLPGKPARILHLLRAPIFSADGRVDYIITSAADITQERARNDELQLASKVFETTADAIVISDADDRVVMVNSAFSKLTGFDPEDVLGQILAESPFRPIDVENSRARMEIQRRDGFLTAEVPRIRKDGTPLSLWVTASTVHNDDGTVRNYVRVFTDISLLKATQQRLEQLASFDALTGVPNRRLLNDRLEQTLRRMQRRNDGLAVMFIDLDGFKNVNDSHGHAIGDLALQAVASRLQRCVRSSDSVGRLGGDEFAIVLDGARLPADAALVGERIVAAMAEPLILEGHRLTLAASIGIAVYPDDGTDAASLLKSADEAMYRVKQAGRNGFRFSSHAPELAAAVG